MSSRSWLKELALAFLFIFLTARPILASECSGLNPSTPDELTAIIRSSDCQITSIDELLKVLIHPVEPVVVYQGHSPQGPYKVDYLNPRAIIGPFGNKTHQLFLAFNGKPDQPNYKNLEVLAVDKNIPRPRADFLNYFDYQFDSEGKNLPWKKAQQLITQSDGHTCVQCHGAPARPIFPGYPSWPGMYGSFDLTVNLAEKQHWDEFKTKAQNSERYRYLNFENDPLTSINIDGKLVDSILRGTNNSHLDFVLEEINTLRVARMVQETSDYSKFKFAALGTMLNCNAVDGFFPDSVRSQMDSNLDKLFELSKIYNKSNSYKILEEVYKLGPNQFGAIPNFSEYGSAPFPSFDEFVQKLERYWAPSKTIFKLWLDTIVKQGPQRITAASTKMRYAFESRDIDISNWFMDLRQPTYRMLGGGEAVFGIALQKDDPDFSRFILEKDDGQHNPSYSSVCEELKSASVQALADFKVKPFVRKPENTKSGYPLIFAHNCAVCHDSAIATAPYIPLSDEGLFRTWVSTGGHRDLVIQKLTDPESSRMPLDRNLSPRELSNLMRYLKSLKVDSQN